MTLYANPRFYVGPKTNELIIPVDRTYGVQLGNLTQLTMTFKKRSVSQPVESIWVSYAIKNGNAHFEIPLEFRTNAEDFPKGFYDGVVFTDDECKIGCVELIKAPGRYLQSGQSVQDRCEDQEGWVEPECSIELNNHCGCSCVNGCDKDGCTNSCNEVYVAQIPQSLIEYAGLDELMSEDCPVLED